MSGAVAALALAPAAEADPQVSLHVSLTAARLGVSIRISDEQTADGVPPPLRTLTIELPRGAGLSLARSVSVCRPAALRAHGAAGCPASSRVGRGSATLEVHAGSQTIPEPAVLSMFRGPALGGRPTLELLGVGHSPLDQRSVSRGVISASAQGLQLRISIPPIHSLELEPDASFTAMSLKLGGPGTTVVLPRSCEGAGLPFGAELAFSDGSSAQAAQTVPCLGR
ncbi:MAG TPA: hypothetical protein VGG08_11390 [Solirubrobacteraceae bacterium]